MNICVIIQHIFLKLIEMLKIKTDTEISVIEEAFKSLSERNDVGIILINQSVSWCCHYT